MPPGHSRRPFEPMKFTLTYEGPLPSSGNPRGRHIHTGDPKAIVKWTMRRKFARQLSHFFDLELPLQNVGPNRNAAAAHVRQPVIVSDIPFLPLVRGAPLDLICELDIKMLVNHEPGSLVVSPGDLDNRVKTLIDALRVPDANALKGANDIPNPCHCLLADDAIVTKLNIRTERWLNAESEDIQQVKLDIGVDITTRRSNFYTEVFGIH